MIEASACPFCGNPETKLSSVCWKEIWFVECMGGECGAQGPLRRVEEEAVAAWNAPVGRPAHG